jgi:hypothetical protein
MMEAARTSETSVDNHFTRQYNPEDSSEHHWFLTLREEQRFKVFENRVLMSIFGPRKDEVTGGLRKQLNEKLYNLYSSPNIITMIKQKMR